MGEEDSAKQVSAESSQPLGVLADRIGATLEEGDAQRRIQGIASLERAGPLDLSFVGNPRYARLLARSRAGAVLLAAEAAGLRPPEGMACLRTSNPYLALARALEIFHPRRQPEPGVHSTAIIHPTARLGRGVFIGAYVVIAEEVDIGEDAALYPHVVVYAGAKIGARCRLHSHCVVREGVVLGQDVVLQNGAVIGADGFGFALTPEKTWHPIPQVAGVLIGDRVEVQAHACVDRGAIDDTTIGEGTKIDNLAQVGHGSTVGKHVLLCGQVGVAGSTRIEDHAVLGGQVGVAGHLTVGAAARVAAQSGIIHDLEGNQDYGGTPAVPIRQALATQARLARLPETLQEIKELRRRVEALLAERSKTESP